MNIDEAFPAMGPCAFCADGTDANHRIKDAILDRYKAGETVADLASDYDVSPDAILAVVAITEVKT